MRGTAIKPTGSEHKRCTCFNFTAVLRRCVFFKIQLAILRHESSWHWNLENSQILCCCFPKILPIFHLLRSTMSCLTTIHPFGLHFQLLAAPPLPVCMAWDLFSEKKRVHWSEVRVKNPIWSRLNCAMNMMLDNLKDSFAGQKSHSHRDGENHLELHCPLVKPCPSPRHRESI